MIVFDCLLPTTLLQVRYEMETAQNSANFVWRKRFQRKSKQKKKKKVIGDTLEHEHESVAVVVTPK